MKILIVCTSEYCFSTSELIEGLHNLNDKNIEFKVTEKANYSYVNNESFFHDYHIEDKEAIEYGKDADIIVQTSNRFVKTDIIKKINRYDKTVYIDGIDEEQLSEIPSKFRLFFKREKLVFYEYKYDNIIPFPFGIENRYFTSYVNHDLKKIYNLNINDIKFNQNKHINLSCAFGKTDRRKLWRSWIEETLKNLKLQNSSIGGVYSKNKFGDEFYIDTGNRYHKPYFNNLYDSKISIDAYGADGASTGRWFESVANGCLIICLPIRTIIPENPFIENEDYLAFADKDELIDKINYCFTNWDMVEKIAQSAFNKAMNFHLNKHRARYFINICKEYMNILRRINCTKEKK